MSRASASSSICKCCRCCEEAVRNQRHLEIAARAQARSSAGRRRPRRSSMRCLKTTGSNSGTSRRSTLRKKQLVGVEAFARARHPNYGVLLPAAFMPGASESSLIALSELALAHSLKAALELRQARRQSAAWRSTFRSARWSKMPVIDIVQSYRPQFEKWPGLIIDVPEEQIVSRSGARYRD